MNTYTGFLTKIAIKEGRSGRGPWKLYSGRVEKEDGTEYDKWLSFGFDAPKAKEGDYVEIQAETDAKGYEQVQSVKVLKNPPAKAAVPAGEGPAVRGPASGGKERSIHYQSARKDAIEMLNCLIEKDALPITADKAKAGQAKRYEELMALVDKLTVRYFNDTETQRILTTVVDEGAIEAEVGALPAGETGEEDDA
jgi:hypothetical protein